MKTSNKIFISFLIFLFGGITLLFIGSKYYKGYDGKSNFAIQEKPLISFSVVVAEPGANFTLKTGKKNKIIQNYLKDVAPNFASYEVRNDTLFVYAVKKVPSNGQAQQGESFFIVPDIFCQNVKSIITNESSSVHLNDFQADSIMINMNKSQLDWRFKKIAYISIQAKDSDIYFEGEKLEKLIVKLDKTKLNTPIKKRGNYLSGSLINESDCSFNFSTTVHLDADKSSRYGFYIF